MTEIPEHLLKRSQARKKALTGEGEGEEAAATSESAPSGESAPAAAAAAAPVLAAPPPESTPVVQAQPDIPVVAAAKARKKVPGWVVPVLAFLPVWAILYSNVLERKEEAAATGPLALGAEIYTSSCASCHGATGGGGVGPQLSGGEVLLTFPTLDEQLTFVGAGSKSGEAYGAADRPGGGRVGTGGMPAWGGSLTEEELFAVVCHERVTFGGADAETEGCAGDAAAGGEAAGAGH